MHDLTRMGYVAPGYILLPAQPVRLYTVIGAGVAISLFDKRQRRGGMAHYAEPIRRHGSSSPHFAGPAVVSLVNAMLDTGADPLDLEACLFGGTGNPTSSRHVPGLAERNVEVGFDLLKRMGVPVNTTHLGGSRGRKVVFHTGTGESIVATVERIRDADWYPRLPGHG